MQRRRNEKPMRQRNKVLRVCAPVIMFAAMLTVAAVFSPPVLAQTTTTVADTIHAPDGGLPSGQIVISATSTFTAADGTVVFQGTVATVPVTNGAFSVALIPNAGSTPSGTSYNVLYKLSGVTYRNETWVVPSAAGPVKLADVRAATISGPSAVVAASQLPAVINASAIQDKGGQAFNAKAYGAMGDGTTDDTAAVQSAINNAIANGGVVYFPTGTYLIAGALTIPNDGGSPPNQKPLRLTGELMDVGSVGGGKTPANGAILNLTETSDAYAKIDTRGAGYLEIDHLTLEDTAGDSVPFVQSTNTIVHIHDNAFIGSKNTTACDQDAIVLGGSTSNTDGSGTAEFQGYGSIIRDNWFNHIRRAVFLAADANGVQVVDNTIWSESGSDLANGSAIYVDPNGAAGKTNTGNYIAGNLIELVGYDYGISLGTASANILSGNNMFDPGAQTVAGILLGANASTNFVICGFTGGKPCKSDLTSNGNNAALDSTGNAPSTMGATEFDFNKIVIKNPTASFANGPEMVDSTGNSLSWQINSGGTYPSGNLQLTPNGGSVEQLFTFYLQPSVDQFYYGETGKSTYLYSADKDIRFIANSSTGAVWLGNSSGQPTYFTNILMHVGAKAAFTGQIVQTPVAFASAPACNSGNEGSIQAITDSTVNTWGSTIAGSGTNHVLGYCDGTNWTVMAK